jgi:hypothetical protein
MCRYYNALELGVRMDFYCMEFYGWSNREGHGVAFTGLDHQAAGSGISYGVEFAWWPVNANAFQIGIEENSAYVARTSFLDSECVCFFCF